MDRNHRIISPNGESGFGFSSSTGSSPDVDLSGAPGVGGSDVDAAMGNWESDWIDLGGEG
jgi:hypothetical protein